MRIRVSVIAALLVLLALAVPAAQAQSLWGLLLYDPVQCAPPGATLTYHGALTNYAQTDLAGILTATALGPYFTGFGFDPALLTALQGGVLPVAGYSGPIFSLTWVAGAPDGYQFTGSVGGWFGLPNGFGESHMADYTAGVCGAPPVPEPSALLLLGGSVIGLLAWRRRRA